MNVVWAAIICIALFIIIWYLCWGSAHRRRHGHELGETQSTQATGTVESRGSDSQYAQTQPDDLTRIKGIGNVIERKLHTLGITTFEQIANFDTADIERVNQVLDFVGRIEREKWVEQARELARP